MKPDWTQWHVDVLQILASSRKMLFSRVYPYQRRYIVLECHGKKSMYAHEACDKSRVSWGLWRLGN